MLGFLRIISVTAGAANWKGNSVLVCVRVQHSRLFRNRVIATVAGSDGKTISGVKVGAVALSRGVRHDVTAVHVGGWRPVGADPLRRAARGQREHATLFRLDGWLGHRHRAQLL